MVAYKATGIKQDALAEEIDLPDGVWHVWSYFNELHHERTGNGFGPNVINSTGIKHWCQVNNKRLEAWELKAIKALDKLWMESIRKNV